MKKISIILLTIFYFAVASGLTVSLHYCGGKLKEISLFNSNNEEGCCGSKKKSKGCCNEKNAFIKIKDSHKLSSNNVSFIYFKTVDVIFPSSTSFNVIHKNTDHFRLKYNSPPVLYDNPLYLKHKVLLV